MNDAGTRSSVSIEMLESRTFLSASPIVHPPAAASIQSTKVTATVPAMKGTVYNGPVTSGGEQATLILVFTTESKTGAVHGSMAVTASTGTKNFIMTGTVTKARKVTLHGHGIKKTITITGTLSTDLSTITGRYAATGSNQNLHGALTLTKYVTPVV
jgi:hypothetical protein